MASERSETVADGCEERRYFETNTVACKGERQDNFKAMYRHGYKREGEVIENILKSKSNT